MKTLSEFYGFLLKKAVDHLKQIPPNEMSREEIISLLDKEFKLSPKRAAILLAVLEHTKYDVKGINKVLVTAKNDQASEDLEFILSLKPADLHQPPIPADLQISQRARFLRDNGNIGVYTNDDNVTDHWKPVRAWVIYSEFSGRVYDVDYAFEFDGQIHVHAKSFELDFMHLHGQATEWAKAFIAAKVLIVLVNPRKTSESEVFDLSC
jgi:hypothetical protein